MNTFSQMVWNFLKYTPSIEQQAFHDCGRRLKLAAGGVGAGKSYSTARELDQYTPTRDGLGWIIGPTYELAQPEFDYLLEAYADIGGIIEGKPSNPRRGGSSFRTVWGFEWCTKSATDMDGIAGRRPDVIAVTEAAQHPSTMFYKALERGTEKAAPLIFSGTFEGAYGWYAEQWSRWQGSNPEHGASFSIPTWSNLAVYPGGRSDEKLKSIEATMPSDLFMERYGGIPCKPSGTVYKEFDPKTHIRPLAQLYTEGLPVELWADPATHCYAILFVQVQKDGKTVHVLDELYAKNQIAQQVIPQVIEKTGWVDVDRLVSVCWWKNVTNGVIDTAGSYRQMGGQSQIEIWDTELRSRKQHGVNWSFHYWPQEQKRNAIHLRLRDPSSGEPLVFFADTLNDRIDADGSANGILGELKTHTWADRGEMASMPKNPIKKNGDALDALGYGCLHHFGPLVQRAAKKTFVLSTYY